ncbi:MAG: PKD domain-containing protein [Candidatus Omnitrophica bacterium]|nr:PKD domain-containing protein [Candidatus Omnitrophota bacterium]
MKKFIAWSGLFFLMCLGVVPAPAKASEMPADGYGFEYFYVFGTEAKKTTGAEDNEQTVFIDVPENAAGDVVVNVFDPDTYKKPDDRGRFSWDTTTVFELYGSKKLDDATFAAGDSTYHQKFYTFGPYPKTSGQKVGNLYRFKLSAHTTDGNDGNLFNVNVKPESAETYSENITFRLIAGHGNKMYFYPEVPKDTAKIFVDSYDLDPTGGSSALYDPNSRKLYDIQSSGSGKWQETMVNLEPGPARRLVYVITKGYQIAGNSGLKVRDAKGALLPIYFKGPRVDVPAPMKKMEPKQEPAPTNACNRFVFDARSSYDPNNDKITYMWDFGDGFTSEESVVTHDYAKGGTYKVKLTVSDNSGLECQTSETAQMVDVNTPPQAAFSGPSSTCTGATINFDASATKDDQPANLTYQWSFGDGTTAEGASVKKTYSEGGVYDVVLTVDDNAGTSCSVDSIRQSVKVNAPPVAEAGEDVTLNLKDSRDDYVVVFDGSKSYDLNNDQLSYRWDFGDGMSAEGRRVEHRYEQGGQYTARLTVDDNFGSSCSVDSDKVNINLNRAPIAVAGNPQSACVGKELTFDGGQSSGEKGETLSYHWDFGDGSSDKGQVVKHSYKQGGEYPVNLVVDDGKNTPVSQSIDIVPVNINAGPKARLGGVEKTCVGDKISFDASASDDPDGDKLSYAWDFGDGTVTSGGAKMSHEYDKGGKYRVQVTVDDGKGSPCSVSTTRITVIVNTPPVADAGPNLVCCEKHTSAFDGSGSGDADGDKLSYAWDFGDGASSTDGAQVSHSYDQSGSYRVVLTVDDGSGTSCSSASSSFVADVNAKPVSVIKFKQA